MNNFTQLDTINSKKKNDIPVVMEFEISCEKPEEASNCTSSPIPVALEFEISCEKCAKEFKTIKNLSDHMIKQHEQVDHFLCLYCKYRSFSADKMEKHINEHSDTTKYKQKEEPILMNGQNTEEPNKFTPLDTIDNKDMTGLEFEISCEKPEEANNCISSPMSIVDDADESNFENTKDSDRYFPSTVSIVNKVCSEIGESNNVDIKEGIETSSASTQKQKLITEICNTRNISKIKELTNAYLDEECKEKEVTSMKRGRITKLQKKVKKARKKEIIRKSISADMEEKEVIDKVSDCLIGETNLHQQNNQLPEDTSHLSNESKEDKPKKPIRNKRKRKTSVKIRNSRKAKNLILHNDNLSDTDSSNQEYTGSTKNHVKMKDPKRLFECEICHKCFKQKYKLNNHSRVHLPTEVRQKLACTHCDKTFVSGAGLEFHIKTHIGKKGHMCEICGMAFYQKGDLTRHMLTHSKEDADRKRCVCSECGKSFSNKNNLKTHMYLHKGGRFFCDICGKGYAQLNDFNIHLKRHKTKDTELPFNSVPCKQCRQRFTTKVALIIHMKEFHKGKRPPTCEFCDKVFASNWKLTVHRRIHTNEHPFSCEVCDKCFKQKNQMDRHKIRKHKHLKVFPSNSIADSVSKNQE